MKFSIIIPVYNADNTVERCVESIIANQFTETEIILVDDCSEDNSWIVCQELSEKYKSVTALHNDKNHGVSFTRNRGLDYATGKYILFVDSDDWVESGYIAAFCEVIEKYSPLFVICGYVNHDEKMNASVDEYLWNDFEKVRCCDLKREIERIYNDNLLQQLWNKVFLREIIENNRIRFDENISVGEDLRFILNYIRLGDVEEAFLINRPLYHYMRDQAGSLMYQVGYESIEEPLKNLNMLYEYIGIAPDIIQTKLDEDRVKQIELYAYLIMHNAGMHCKEKKQLIFALDEESGKMLYKKNFVLYYKERIKILLDKICGKKES